MSGRGRRGAGRSAFSGYSPQDARSGLGPSRPGLGQARGFSPRPQQHHAESPLHSRPPPAAASSGLGGALGQPHLVPPALRAQIERETREKVEKEIRDKVMKEVEAARSAQANGPQTPSTSPQTAVGPRPIALAARQSPMVTTQTSSVSSQSSIIPRSGRGRVARRPLVALRKDSPERQDAVQDTTPLTYDTSSTRVDDSPDSAEMAGPIASHPATNPFTDGLRQASEAGEQLSNTHTGQEDSARASLSSISHDAEPAQLEVTTGQGGGAAADKEPTTREITTRLASLALKDSVVPATNDEARTADDPWALTDDKSTLASDTSLPEDQSIRHPNADGSEGLKKKGLLKDDENTAPEWETSNDGQQVAQPETQNKWETEKDEKDDSWTMTEPWIDTERTEKKETKGSKTSDRDSAPTGTHKENFLDGWTINQDRRDTIMSSPPMSPKSQSQWSKARAFQNHNTNSQDATHGLTAGFTSHEGVSESPNTPTRSTAGSTSGATHRVCQYFLRGYCRRGEDCFNEHPRSPEKPGSLGTSHQTQHNSTPGSRTRGSMSGAGFNRRPCRYFQDLGRCKNGDQCQYEHVREGPDAGFEDEPPAPDTRGNIFGPRLYVPSKWKPA